MSDTTEDRKAWLAGLKVGDEVAVENRMGVEIKRVSRTTKARVFTRNNDVSEAEYNRSDGRLRGNSDSWFPVTIRKPTQADRDKCERSGLEYKLRRASENKALSLSQLRRIAAILDEPKEDKADD